ncbi:tetratricopeptide repeat-containing sensor histidine kinase [Flavobacterium phycosphaerae]|uniref:tetratricopeptide repeat-containing sensor histidine kinase n=1 Tax=Flavobacterium phycosphaerae TaxID=2697515 RepID=UPI0013899C4A|nr:sensor histidine kinase [Flavobacterium phycosphaerae]
MQYDVKIANTTQSVNWFTQNLINAQKLKYHQGIADSYANLGLVYYFQGKYDKNTNCMLHAIRWYDKLKLTKKLAGAYAEYGYQLKKRDMKMALYNMQKGMKMAEANGDEGALMAIYDNYGVLKEMKDELDSALFFYQRAMVLKEKRKDEIGIPYSANKIAFVKLMQKKPEDAKRLFDYAYQIRLKINDIFGIAENLNFYGYYFKEIGKDKEAIVYFKKAILWSQKNHYPSLLEDNYRGLSEVYENNNDFKNALVNYKNHVLSKDSIMNTDIRTKQAELDTQYQTEQKEKEILLQRAQIAEKNIWILGAFSLALFAILIGFIFFNRQKLKTIQLQKDNELKDALLKIETQTKLQEQRLRISRDLHDNIGAQLTFIISSLDNLKYGFHITDERLEEKLSSISGFTKETIYELRDTIWAMNKDEITFEDLKSRISNFIGKAKLASQDIEFEFNCDDQLKANVFSSVEGMNVYRIIQEAINNSLKHARASKITVTIFKEKDTFQITINDNGKGFDEAEILSGNGMNNLKKRAKELNGEITITSQEQSGTTVILCFKKP